MTILINEYHEITFRLPIFLRQISIFNFNSKYQRYILHFSADKIFSF